MDGKELLLPDIKYIYLISELGSWQEEKIVMEKIYSLFPNSDQAQKCFDNLHAHKIIVSEEEFKFYNLEGLKHWHKRNWLDALILHLKTKDMRYYDDKFQDVTISKNQKHDIFEEIISKEKKLELWKTYPQSLSFDLPLPKPLPEADLAEVLLKRRTGKPWTKEELEIGVLSDILFHVNKEGMEIRKRLETAFSNVENLENLLLSSFTALETYLFVFKVNDLEPGLYHYNLQTHQLTLIKGGDFRNDIAKICIGQRMPKMSSCTFIITAVWERYMFRYRHSRAYRNLLVNVAELAHKYIIAATTYELSTWLTPAFNDEYAEKILNVDGYEEAPLYAVSIG